ncbi:hypothetical protein KC686_03290 [Candidatus Woesebacteria bacterium]|nr:hypothetical protein [Candidatus Woesebacteria bacterium]
MSKIETSTLTGSTEAKRLAEGIRNDVGWAEKKRAYAQELQKERNYFPVPPEMEYIRDSYKQEQPSELREIRSYIGAHLSEHEASARAWEEQAREKKKQGKAVEYLRGRIKRNIDLFAKEEGGNEKHRLALEILALEEALSKLQSSPIKRFRFF